MAKRKLSDKEKTQKRINRIEKIVDSCLGLVENLIKKGKEKGEKEEKDLHTGKLKDILITIGTSIDQLKKLTKEQEELPGEDLTAKWSEETVQLFLKWLKKDSEGYYKYLMLIKDNPKLLEKILKTKVKEPEKEK